MINIHSPTQRSICKGFDVIKSVHAQPACSCLHITGCSIRSHCNALCDRSTTKVLAKRYLAEGKQNAPNEADESHVEISNWPVTADTAKLLVLPCILYTASSCDHVGATMHGQSQDVTFLVTSQQAAPCCEHSGDVAASVSGQGQVHQNASAHKEPAAHH